MGRRVRRALLVLPLCLSLGCIAVAVDAVTDPLGRKSALRLAQREYTKHVRWGDLEAAASFVHPDLRDRYLGYEQEFAGIRVTDFDVGELHYGQKLRTASVRVTYRAYSIASMVEIEIRETQQWERLAGNAWVVGPARDGILDSVGDFRL